MTSEGGGTQPIWRCHSQWCHRSKCYSWEFNSERVFWKISKNRLSRTRGWKINHHHKKENIFLIWKATVRKYLDSGWSINLNFFHERVKNCFACIEWSRFLIWKSLDFIFPKNCFFGFYPLTGVFRKNYPTQCMRFFIMTNFGNCHWVMNSRFWDIFCPVLEIPTCLPPEFLVHLFLEGHIIPKFSVGPWL